MHSAFALLADMSAATAPATSASCSTEPSPSPSSPSSGSSPTPSRSSARRPARGGVATSPGTPSVNPTTRPHPLLPPPLDPQPRLGLVMVVLFFAVLANLDSTARFLYFQF